MDEVKLMFSKEFKKTCALRRVRKKTEYALLLGKASNASSLGQLMEWQIIGYATHK